MCRKKTKPWKFEYNSFPSSNSIVLSLLFYKMKFHNDYNWEKIGNETVDQYLIQIYRDVTNIQS